MKDTDFLTQFPNIISIFRKDGDLYVIDSINQKDVLAARLPRAVREAVENVAEAHGV